MNYIEFPKLDIAFNIDNVAFKVFGVSIYWYGIIIAVGFVIAIILALRDSSKFDMKQDYILDAVLYSTPVAIICARLFYVIFNWESFRDKPLEIFNTRSGGLAIYGGVIGAFLTAYIYARIKKINFLKFFDFAIVYLPLAQAIGRWGNFINQEAYGTHTELPWGMSGSRIIDGPVHPAFLYESLWNLATFFVLIWFRKRKKIEGEVFSLYMVLYGAGRAWIEGLRTDSLMLGNIRINQLLAIIFAVFFTVLIFIRRSRAASFEITDEVKESSNYGDILKKLKEDEEQNTAEIREIEIIENESSD